MTGSALFFALKQRAAARLALALFMPSAGRRERP